MARTLSNQVSRHTTTQGAVIPTVVHVTQGSAPESGRHPQHSPTLDGNEERNGCVAQMDMPLNHAAVPADESRASADEIELPQSNTTAGYSGERVPGQAASISPLVNPACSSKDSLSIGELTVSTCEAGRPAVKVSEVSSFPPSLCTLAGGECSRTEGRSDDGQSGLSCTAEGTASRGIADIDRADKGVALAAALHPASAKCQQSDALFAGGSQNSDSENQASPALLTLSSPQGLVLERVKPTEPAILEMVRAHYSHKVNCQKRERTAKTSKNWWGPAKLIVFSDLERTFVFAWQWPKAEYRADKQSGFNNTLFHRTERCPFRASEIILAAEQAAVKEWGENRAYSYIDSKETRKTKRRGKRVIGYCYLKAGWRFVKVAASGKHLFEKHLVSSPQGESSAEQGATLVSALEFESGLSGEANSLAGEIPNSKPAQCESGAGKDHDGHTPAMESSVTDPAPGFLPRKFSWASTITPVQIEMLEACRESEKHCGSALYLRSMWNLKAAGLIETHFSHWYGITQKGKEFLKSLQSPKPTKKAYRELLNKQGAELPNHRHNRYRQLKRGYGDYLYFQDRVKFDFEYEEWAKEMISGKVSA